MNKFWLKFNEHQPTIFLSAAIFMGMLLASWLMGSLYVAMQSNLELNRQQLETLAKQDKILAGLQKMGEEGAEERKRLMELSEQQSKVLNNHDKIFEQQNKALINHDKILGRIKSLSEAAERRFNSNDQLNRDILQNQDRIMKQLELILRVHTMPDVKPTNSQPGK